jgi:hypothetical protein
MKRSSRDVHTRLLLKHNKKKLAEREEKMKDKENLFFLLFFIPGRATRAMLIECEMNVSVL